jgi:O-antigen ligase
MEPPCSVQAMGRAPFPGGFPVAPPAAVGSLGEGRPAVPDARRVSAAVRWAFYGFAFSIFFEYPQRSSLPVEIPTVAASFFLLVALLHPGVCFGRPPPVAWRWLAIYLGLWVTMAMFSEHPAGGKGPLPMTLIISLLTTQILLLFWVAYNLLSNDEIANVAIWMLAAGAVLLKVLAILHLVPSYWWYGRLYIMGQNCNTLAHHLSVGLVALIGLAMAWKGGTRWPLFLVPPCAALLLYTIVQSGSRGGVVTVAIGVLALTFRRGGFGQQIRTVLVCVLLVGFLCWAVTHSPSMSRRYEKTFNDTDMAGREDLFPNAWQMFLEKPLLGWGPIDNWDELGRRAPLRRDDHPEGEREPHNFVLEVLTSTGLTGAIPIFTCLALCTRAAWRARAGPQGSLPLALVVTALVVNMSGTFLMASKLDWLVMAYAVASGDLVLDRRSRWAAARVDGAPDQLSAPTASPSLRDEPKRPNSPLAGAKPEQRLRHRGEST